VSRSAKKGPYIDDRLLKKLKRGDKEPIKTWSRSCQIPPQFVGHYFAVHNGRDFIEVFITEDMVGHRLGEFSPTRMFKGHGRMVKRTIEKT